MNRFIIKSKTNRIRLVGSANISGIPGPKGDDGEALKILGSLTDVSELPVTGHEGDAYIVDGDLYIWIEDTGWINSGRIVGPGLPLGGTDGQIVVKQGATDFATVWVTLTKDLIGLGNVDNTSDVNKPISTATQTAIDTIVVNANNTYLYKSNNLSDITNASTARTNLGLVIGTNVLAPNGNGSLLTGLTQSQISGLVSDLALKAPLASPTFTGTLTVSGGGSLVLGEATNIPFGTTTGTKIGTSITQKLGFYNATPVIRPTLATDFTYAVTNALVDRGYDADVTSIDEVADVLATMSTDLVAVKTALKTLGLLG
jgi:hypothetical protein